MSAIAGKSIELFKVRKSWGDSVALEGIDLFIDEGKFTAILGPSGCGKSTTLRCIAGLESVTSGEVHIGNKPVTTLPPAKRQLAMVFQNYALFPHLSVAENIIFGLRVEKLSRKERRARLAEVAELLELSDYLHRKPAALSGGQQQRVALGRAVISRRPVCLMDEPLSNLDARLRDGMRREIRALQRKLGFTMVYVTHDQTEAITMADQVVLMNNGRIEQVSTPQEIYQNPQTPFSARFIGTPPMNLLPEHAFRDNDGQLLVGIRPEVLRIADNGPLSATVNSIEYLGADNLVELTAGSTPLLAKLASASHLTPGQTVTLTADPADVHLFDPDTNQRLTDEPRRQRLFGLAS